MQSTIMAEWPSEEREVELIDFSVYSFLNMRLTLIIILLLSVTIIIIRYDTMGATELATTRPTNLRLGIGVAALETFVVQCTRYPNICLLFLDCHTKTFVAQCTRYPNICLLFLDCHTKTFVG